MWLLPWLLGPALSAAFVTEFRDPRHPEPLQSVALRPCRPAPCSGADVYVGGTDALYHLDADLRPIGRASTGPALDSPLCPPPPRPCAHNRTLARNENRVLLLTPDDDLLLACGTLYQGACRLHQADAVATSAPVGPANESVSSVSGLGSTVAFWGSAHELYIAASYDGRPPPLSPASVSRRILFQEGGGFSLRYAHRTDKELSGVDFATPYKRTYKVEYVYGFRDEGHAYWVTVQPVSGETDGVRETRLARVCERDPRFLSYAELPLGCRLGGQPYLYAAARSAHLGVASAALRNRLKMGRGSGGGAERLLLVSFVSAVPGHPRLADRRRGSVVCSFPMAAVRAAFANATAACFAAEPRTRLLKHVVGADAPCTPREDVRADEAGFCGSEFNPFVEGRDPVQGGVRLHLEADVTMLFTTLQNGNAVLFAGTHDGQLVKVHLDRSRQSNLFWQTIADVGAEDKRIRPSHAYDAKTGNLYLLAGDKVVRFPAASCAAYGSCAKCLSAEDPLACGWCGDRCAHRDECGTPDILSHDQCPPILQAVSPLSGPLSGGTLVTISGDNFGRPAEGEEVSRIQIEIAGQPCHLHSWDKERVQCRTSNVSEPVSGNVRLNVSDSTWILGLFSMEGEAQSDQLFEYVSPRLLDIFPDYGPVSGNTSLTLVGEWLDVGLDRSVDVCGVPCRIVEVSRNRTRCLTGARNNSGPCADSPRMRIDGAEMRIEGRTFRYLPDPEVSDIQPRVAMVSGATNVTVFGSHLDSVAEPRMLVVVASPLTKHKMEFRTACRVFVGGTRMECRSPRLPVGALRSPTERAPLVGAASFELDGARAPRELPLRRPEISQLLFYPDPRLADFPDNRTLKLARDRAFLTLQGEYLDLVLQPQEVDVSVGGASCEVSAISRNELVCVLPPGGDTPVPVHVRMGSIMFSPGWLKLVPAESSPKAGIIVGCLLAFGACACLVAFLLWRRSRRRKPPSYMVAYSAEPARANGANADACGGPPRRQGSRGNDYHDLRGRILAARAAQQQVQEQQEEEEGGVDEETMHLLRAENILIERECLTLGEVIGQGHFGCVYKGDLRMPDQEESTHVAVKTLHSSGAARDVEAFLQEALMMKDFRHRNVLALVGVCFEARGSPMVVIPFMRNGDLHSYIRDEQHNPTVKDLLTFGVQIAAGMNYLAELKFVHRDLAARNCMLSGEQTVKVADFGLSRDIYERDYYSSDNKKTKLPVKWMAPESLEKGTYSTKTDVWSYGVVLWELMTRGVTPYPDVDNWDILHYLKSGRRMPQPSYCPDLLYEIMLRCWLEEGRDRPTFGELEEGVQGVITTLQKAGKQRTVGLNVTYVNYPRVQGDQGPSTDA